MAKKIFVGTRKGTFVVDRVGATYAAALAGHVGMGVAYAARDPHRGTIWAALSLGHWGAKLSRSDDGGKTWVDATQIQYPEGARYLVGSEPGSDGEKAPSFKPAKLLKLWTMAFCPSGAMYVGTIPGGLFVSRDGGESFSLNLPLWNHESRGGDLFAGDGSGQTHWFGTPASEAGEFAPGIHSIALDPRDPRRILVAVSTAGVLETTDGGETWRGRNRGLLMDYLPNPSADWGHDPHFVARCPGQPDHVWQQNHCGVFYSDSGAEQWRKVSAPDQGVHFGFPVAVDEQDGKTAWVVPGVSDMQRMAIDGSVFAARTTDGGESWAPLRNGLPQQSAYDVVYRHALDIDGERLAFGSTTGNLYISEDRGDNWRCLGNNLPPIYSVRFG